MYAMTAAHKTLPLGTRVSVRNIENGRQINVRINDRGPFVRGRIIDLSYTGAQKLGLVGPGTAAVEVIALATPIEADAPPTVSIYTAATSPFKSVRSEFVRTPNAIEVN